MKKQAILYALIGLTLSINAFSENRVVLKSRSFPGNLKEDGFWAGLYAARDGKVYIGLNTEGGGSAQFYIYDPQTDQICHRADMSEFLGEKGKGVRTHAKIHTRFCEDREGRIYFATGNMGAGPAAVDPRSWKGGHWCRYDPRTGSRSGIDRAPKRRLRLDDRSGSNEVVRHIRTGSFPHLRYCR